MIYTLAGHLQSSARCVVTCNHTQSFGAALLFVSLQFFFLRTTPWLYGLFEAFGGFLFDAMNEFA